MVSSEAFAWEHHRFLAMVDFPMFDYRRVTIQTGISCEFTMPGYQSWRPCMSPSTNEPIGESDHQTWKFHAKKRDEKQSWPTSQHSFMCFFGIVLITCCCCFFFSRQKHWWTKMTTLSRYSPICAKKRALHSSHPHHPDLVAPWVYTFTHARSNTKKTQLLRKKTWYVAKELMTGRNENKFQANLRYLALFMRMIMYIIWINYKY